MTDNRPIERPAGANCDPAMPHVSNTNQNRQDQAIPSSSHSTLPNINPRTAFNIGARTAEHSRILADNISSTIRPLIQHVTPSISLRSFLMHGLQYQVQPVTLASHNYTINMGEHPSSSTAAHSESIREHHMHEVINMVAEIQNNNNNAIENTIVNNNEQLGPEARKILELLQQYIPFLFILLTKFFYDHKTGILMFIVLFVTFMCANNSLKREIAKQNNRSHWLLLLILCYITACFVFVAYTLELYTFIPVGTKPHTIWNLLYYIMVVDLFLKLITIVCKVLLTCLPVRLLAFQSRGKYYLFMEATSQLCRCFAAMPPWLSFLSTYRGPEIIVGILFCLTYACIKWSEAWPRLHLFFIAIRKLYQNVNLGISPSKEEVIASGGICAICHEKYSTPVRLHCKHIFCEICISTWLDRERSCPLCRTSITDNPIYRDGHTTYLIQLY